MKKGYLDTVNCPVIRKILSTLDDNSKLLIVEMGSLRALLALCPKFSFDEKNKNAVYLTSQKEAYKESKRKLTQQNESCIPKFHDPLFNGGLDIYVTQTASTEIIPIKSRPKTKSEISDKDKNANNEKSVNANLSISDIISSKTKNSCHSNISPTVNKHVSSTVPGSAKVDCTKSNNIVYVDVSKHKNISDVSVFNDAKKGEEVEYKIINDPTSPRKKDKKKKGKSRLKDSGPVKHVCPSIPSDQKSKLHTYLEDKIDAERNNKDAKYCCPLLGDNCSCAEIETFRDDTAKSSNKRVRVMKVITIEPEGKQSDTDDDDSGSLANVLELIHNKHAGQQKRSSSYEQLCVVEVGIQCDLNNVKKMENDKECLKLFNEDLIKRLKESLVSNEKLSSDFEKYREKHRVVVENQQAENKSHKAALEVRILSSIIVHIESTGR